MNVELYVTQVELDGVNIRTADDSLELVTGAINDSPFAEVCIFCRVRNETRYIFRLVRYFQVLV